MCLIHQEKNFSHMRPDRPARHRCFCRRCTSSIVKTHIVVSVSIWKRVSPFGEDVSGAVEAICHLLIFDRGERPWEEKIFSGKNSFEGFIVKIWAM